MPGDRTSLSRANLPLPAAREAIPRRPAASEIQHGERRSRDRRDRLLLALEFADLDDPSDEIWIDLAPAYEEQLREERPREPSGDPATFFDLGELLADESDPRSPSSVRDLAPSVAEPPTRTSTGG